MRNSRWMVCLSLALSILMVATPVLADVNAALLQAQGEVRHNGATVEQTSALLEGDHLETGSDSAAAITASGSTVMVPANSSVIYRENGIDVLCGTAIVTTSAGMNARVSNFTVEPASSSARFQLRQSPEGLQVVAVQGTLAINDGQHSLTLEPGKAMNAKGGCLDAGYYTASARTTVPQPASAPARPAASSSFLGGSALTAILVVAGFTAAVVSGIVVASNNDETAHGF